MHVNAKAEGESQSEGKGREERIRCAHDYDFLYGLSIPSYSLVRLFLSLGLSSCHLFSASSELVFLSRSFRRGTSAAQCLPSLSDKRLSICMQHRAAAAYDDDFGFMMMIMTTTMSGRERGKRRQTRRRGKKRGRKGEEEGEKCWRGNVRRRREEREGRMRGARVALIGNRIPFVNLN